MRKKTRLFISYSHVDTKYFEEFRKHLIVLERNGDLFSWHDRKLRAGDRLQEVIQENLGKSDIVCFLVSSDFLASTSAYRDEFETALHTLRKKNMRLVPIIVRSCNWERTPLSEFVAANIDGKPVSSADDPDRWWLDVSESISRIIADYSENRHETANATERPTLDYELSMVDEFAEFLNDTQVPFQHRHCENVSLSDVYVYPDLKEITKEYTNTRNYESALGVLQLEHITKHTLLFGDDQVGKSALLRRTAASFYQLGALPLLVNGGQIVKSDLSRFLATPISKQYLETDYSSYTVASSDKVLLIDDFDEIPLNSQYFRTLLENLSNYFDKLVVCVDPSFRLNEEKYAQLSEYRQFEMLPMGHQRRGELISKWNSLGRRETIQASELESLNDVAARHINAIVKNSVVPPKPIYIITILQVLDSARPADYSLTSYGHCYQTLIHASLLRLKITARQFDLYLNYLAEYSHFLFEHRKDSLDRKEPDTFKAEYERKFVIRSHEEVIENLTSADILRLEDDKLSFKYEYIFYFFVAKHLSDHLEEKSVKQSIYDLCGKLHVEKYANILIFLVHHSKDTKIIDELLLNAGMVFEEYSEATLDTTETSYLGELFGELPKLIIEKRNVEEERKRELALRDELESDYESDGTEEDAVEIIADMHRSFRIVEIIGQILRNRQSSLTKEQIGGLMKAAYNSGLKFLKFYLGFTEQHKTDMVQLISLIIDSESVEEDKADNAAQQIFLSMCYGISHSVIKKLADSTGSADLVAVAAQVINEDEATPAFRLIELAMKLEFQKKIPKKEIEDLHKYLSKNVMAQRMLKDIVVRHLYLHSVPYFDRQWISDKLEIPVRAQRVIQRKEARYGN